MEAAEGGDMDAVRLLVQLGMPRTKAVSIPIALPGGPDGVLAALEAGEIAPDEAKTMLADFFNISDGNEVELTLSNNGLRGLAMLLDHCADLTIDAIGIIPSGPLQMAGGNHEAN